MRFRLLTTCASALVLTLLSPFAADAAAAATTAGPTPAVTSTAEPADKRIAIPVLRSRGEGGTHPFLYVIRPAAFGLTSAEVAAALPTVPAPGDPGWVSPWDVVKKAKPIDDVVDRLAELIGTSMPAGSAFSAQAALQNVKITIYSDASNLAYGDSIANTAWNDATSILSSQGGLTFDVVLYQNDAVAYLGTPQEVDDVTNDCELQRFSRWEEGFARSPQAQLVLVFSDGQITLRDHPGKGPFSGYAMDGNVSKPLSRGEGEDMCAPTSQREWRAKPFIPSSHVSTNLAWVPNGLGSQKNSTSHWAAHEIGHQFGMEHSMAKCTDVNAFTQHKTLEAATSGGNVPSNCTTSTTKSYYIWTFNDPGMNAIKAENQRFSDCRAAGWCAQDATPSAPRDLVAQVGNGQVTLSWQPPQYNGTNGITGYCVYKSPVDNFQEVWSGPNAVSKQCTTGTSYTWTGLTNGVTSYYYVRAKNNNHPDPSQPQQNGDYHGPRSDYMAVAPAGVPGTPTLHSITAGNARLDLSWTPSGDTGGYPLNGWKIYRGTCSGCETQYATLTNGSATSYTDFGVTNGTSYFYKVAATNWRGESPQSNEQANYPRTVPAAPTLHAPTAGDGQVSLSWTANGNGGSAISSYKVYRGTSPTNGTLLTSGGCAAPVHNPSCVDSGLTNYTTYHYQVVAVNNAGDSPKSNQVSAQPVPANNLTGTTLTSYPSSVQSGQPFQVCWSVSGTGPVSHTDVHWGTTTGLGNNTPQQTGTAPASFCATVTAPASGTVYLQSHATGSSNSVTSSMVSVSVTPQNDCGTGGDAANSFSAASSVTLPKSNCAGLLSPTTDGDDFYQFWANGGDVINVSMTPNASADFDVCLYNPGGAQDGSCTTGSNGTTDTISRTASGSGYWRVRVTIYNGTGTYALSIATATPANDCGTGGDAGGTHAAAASITLPKSNCTGSLTTSTDDEDWYQFPVTNGQTISISVTPNGTSDYDLCLHDPNGTQAGNCAAAGGSATDAITYTATVTGSWRARIVRYSGTGGYTFSAAVSGGTQNDCGTGGDAANTFGGATSISLPKSSCAAALVNSTDMDDYYQFWVNGGQTINASMTPNANADFDICLYNPGGAQDGACTTGSNGTTDTISRVASGSGYWRLRVTVYAGTGSYTMSVSTANGAITFRDDDGEKDFDMPFNYSDDTAVKRYDILSSHLSGRTSATLYIYGQSYACTGSGNKFRLKAGSNTVAEFNPCNEWSSSAYTWKAFNVPLSYLAAGTNSFSFEHISGGGDWSTRNVNLGVDYDREYNRTDASYDYNTVNGELMWYLVLS